MIKKFSFLLSVKTWFEPIVFPGSFAVFSGAAPPPFRIFAGLRLAEVASATQAGGILRRRRRRNAVGLIQEYCTRKEKSKSFGSPRFALPAGKAGRRLIRIQF